MVGWRKIAVLNTSNKKCLLYQIQVTNWQCWWVMKKPEHEVLITLGPCNDAVSNTSNGFMMVVNEKSKICYWSNVTVTAFTNKQTNTTNTSRYKVDFNVFLWLALCIFFFRTPIVMQLAVNGFFLTDDVIWNKKQPEYGFSRPV